MALVHSFKLMRSRPLYECTVCHPFSHGAMSMRVIIALHNWLLSGLLCSFIMAIANEFIRYVHQFY